MKAGSYCVVRQKKPSSRWKVARVAEFDPCWVVRFSLPGRPVKVESSRLEVCGLCLAVPAEANPVKVRENCRCLRPVVAWADRKLGVMAGLWQAGRLAELEAVLRPGSVTTSAAAAVAAVPVVTVGDLVRAYLSGLPERKRPGGRDNVLGLRTMLTQVTGKEWDECLNLPVTVLSKGLVMDWMRLRQVWNLERSKPEKRRRDWPALRAALAAAKAGDGEALPGLVSDLPLEGNYTINSEYGKARSIVGKKSRTFYLSGLELQALTFGEVSRLAAGAGRAQVSLDGEAMDGLLELGEQWKREDVSKWVAFRLMIGCGLRSVEVLSARRSWLREGEWLDGDGKQWQGWAMVVRNYPQDPALNPGGKVDHLPGFWQKGALADKVRTFRVEGELLETLQAMPEGWLFAPDRTYTGRVNLIGREISKALRPWVGIGSKGTNHRLRKLSITAVAEGQGMDAAAAHGGHTLEVAQEFYARPRTALRVVTDEELRGRAAG